MLLRTPWLAPSVVLFLAGCVEQPPPVVTKGFGASAHQEYFPIDKGAVHELKKPAVDGPISCDSCHLPDKEFTFFMCVDCHERDEKPLETAHGLIDGFIKEDASCLACHPDGKPGLITGPVEPGVDGGPPVDTHSLNDFPIGAGSLHGPDNVSYMARADAADLSHCLACHGDLADRSVTLCASCHAADTDPTLAFAHAPDPVQSGFDAEPDCKACHSEAPVVDLLRMDVHAASSDPDHFNAACFECHDPTQRQVTKPWAIDFTMPAAPVECLPCHVGEPRAYPDADQ